MTAEQTANMQESPWEDIVPQSEFDLIVEFYRRHCSFRAQKSQEEIKQLLHKYQGRTTELKIALERKYEAHHWFDTYQYDFHCKFFDPSKALYDPYVAPPIPNVPPLDNLTKAKLLLPASNPRSQAKTRTGRLRGEEFAEHLSKRDQELERKRALGERFLNRLTGNLARGPLKVVKHAVETQKRVSVQTRRIDGVRGTLIGYVKAFDRHVNLVLVDVDEEYWTYNYEYIPVEPFLSSVKSTRDVPVPEEASGIPEGWILKTTEEGNTFYYNNFTGFCQWQPPQKTVRKRFKRNRRKQLHRRHMNQVLLRGDCVITLSLHEKYNVDRRMSEFTKLKLEN